MCPSMIVWYSISPILARERKGKSVWWFVFFGLVGLVAVVVYGLGFMVGSGLIEFVAEDGAIWSGMGPW